jgi:hypothetical protein
MSAKPAHMRSETLFRRKRWVERGNVLLALLAAAHVCTAAARSTAESVRQVQQDRLQADVKVSASKALS